MKFKLPEIDKKDLPQWVSQENFDYHYGKHHQTYVDNLNKLLDKNSPYAHASLEEIVLKTEGPLFDNASQAWNHTFFWLCMTPDHSVLNSQSALAEAIKEAFGNQETFLKQFKEAAVGVFGSGWAWLVQDMKDKEVRIVTTSNAQNPMQLNLKPLLTCDVWEHAYYIDYRNARAQFVDDFIKTIHWSFVEENYHHPEMRSLTPLMMD